MGLDNATGEYTIHADPDDWVEPTMSEELYAKAIEDNADMVICDYFNEYTDRQVYTPREYRIWIATMFLGKYYLQEWQRQYGIS